MTHAEDGDVMPLSVEKRCVLMHDEVDAEAQDQPLCQKADFQTHWWASPASLQHFFRYSTSPRCSIDKACRDVDSTRTFCCVQTLAPASSELAQGPWNDQKTG